MTSTHGSSLRMAPLLAVLLLCLTAGTVTGADGPIPALEAPTAGGEMRLSPSDRCPVCAMFPARQPASAASMTLTDGTTFYFCSNGCLLRAFLRPAAYLNARPSDIDRLTVRDYFSGQPTDARKATWVAGSNVVGPMGPAIIALADDGQLKTFARRHGSRIVFTLDQLNDDLWKRISRHDLPPAAGQ